jgi:RecA-family ATPase
VEQPWHVPGLIPADTVTLLGGDGGTGKSLLAAQLAAATALGAPWIGFEEIFWGPSIYLSCEDDIDELHRRFDRIIAQMVGRLRTRVTCTLCPLPAKTRC